MQNVILKIFLSRKLNTLISELRSQNNINETVLEEFSSHVQESLFQLFGVSTIIIGLGIYDIFYGPLSKDFSNGSLLNFGMVLTLVIIVIISRDVRKKIKFFNLYNFGTITQGTLTGRSANTAGSTSITCSYSISYQFNTEEITYTNNDKIENMISGGAEYYNKDIDIIYLPETPKINALYLKYRQRQYRLNQQAGGR